MKTIGYVIVYKDGGSYFNNVSSGMGRRYDYPKLYKSEGRARGAIKNSCYVKESEVIIKPVYVEE